MIKATEIKKWCFFLSMLRKFCQIISPQRKMNLNWCTILTEQICSLSLISFSYFLSFPFFWNFFFFLHSFMLQHFDYLCKFIFCQWFVIIFQFIHNSKRRVCIIKSHWIQYQKTLFIVYKKNIYIFIWNLL